MHEPTHDENGAFAIRHRATGPSCRSAILFLLLLVVAALAGSSAQAQDFEFSRVLHSFAGPPDAEGAPSRLALDAQGNLYGPMAASTRARNARRA